MIQRVAAPSREAAWIVNLALLYLLFGGGEAAYLRASIYQEVIFWASAFAAIFVYFAVKGLVYGAFSRRTLSMMAAMTGLVVLTRISTGVGLCTAFSLLTVYLVVQKGRLFGWRATLLGRFGAPLLILGSSLTVAGAVNYARWGNPLSFADFNTYLMNANYAQWLPRMQQQGYFNLHRLPIGIVYYFFPMWVLPGGHGGLLLHHATEKWMNVLELPPSSLLLTDLFPLVFAGLLVAGLKVRPRIISFAPLALLASGLAVPCLLMLTAISMSFRYRMEFYPEIDLLCFIGIYMVLSDERICAAVGRWRSWLTGAVVVSIVSSTAAMVLYKLSYWGPAEAWLGHGVVQFYVQSALP